MQLELKNNSISFIKTTTTSKAKIKVVENMQLM